MIHESLYREIEAPRSPLGERDHDGTSNAFASAVQDFEITGNLQMRKS